MSRRTPRIHYSPPVVVSDDDDLVSEGASDYDVDDDIIPVKHGREVAPSPAAYYAHQSRWHRKVLVALAFAAIIAVWAVRTGRAHPYITTVTTKVDKWQAWANSEAGTHFICILVALIGLDVAVDLGFGVWTRKHPQMY